MLPMTGMATNPCFMVPGWYSTVPLGMNETCFKTHPVFFSTPYNIHLFSLGKKGYGWVRGGGGGEGPA